MTHTISEIVAAHRKGRSPRRTVRDVYARLRAHNDAAMVISLREEADAVALAERLEQRGDRDHLPLYGIPFMAKDNIDVEGLPTTAACPAFAYKPTRSATVVARLVTAGAIAIAKTNLDQFATGLVGVRSPYGVPRNAVDPRLIPGGSSSGSAVAVAAGIVPFSLGTDTAGSGRVPAALNRIVGLKPSLGALSNRGVVPACRSLDTVSVFALTVDDAFQVFDCAAGFDADDPFSVATPHAALGGLPPSLRLGVPRQADRIFFGDSPAEAAYDAALETLRRMGVSLADIDITPFLDAGKLLYEGPWVAERSWVIARLLIDNPEAIHPVTRAITQPGLTISAVAAFDAMYRLADLKRRAETVWTKIDALALPTVPTLYTKVEVENDPIRLNSNLGTYTNFVNLLDLCGLAIPGPDRPDGRPSGLTLIAPSGRDAHLAGIGRVVQRRMGAALGATGAPCPEPPRLSVRAPHGVIEIAVVGAHLSGMRLNRELTDLGAILLRQAQTAPDYRLYALPGGPPERPGLVRGEAGRGATIAVEIWGLLPQAFGRFVANIPSPLSIGTLQLSDGTSCKGFLCETQATIGARDITAFGGWRAYTMAGASAAR